jgi:hypothetical protein
LILLIVQRHLNEPLHPFLVRERRLIASLVSTHSLLPAQESRASACLARESGLGRWGVYSTIGIPSALAALPLGRLGLWGSTRGGSGYRLGVDSKNERTFTLEFLCRRGGRLFRSWSCRLLRL